VRKLKRTFPKSMAFISGKPLPSASTVGRTMSRARQAMPTLKPKAFSGAPRVSVERRSPAP